MHGATIKKFIIIINLTAQTILSLGDQRNTHIDSKLYVWNFTYEN
jgi:hypothetical protein